MAAPLFPLGRIVATPGAIETMTRRGIDPAELLSRHVNGDWGDLDEDDKRENEFSVPRSPFGSSRRTAPRTIPTGCG